MFSQPTRTERAAFLKTYPTLSGVLALYICGQEEGTPEDKILTEYINEEPPEHKRKAIEEGRAFLKQHEIPWTIIPDLSNFYRETEEETQAWLSGILERIEQSLN